MQVEVRSNVLTSIGERNVAKDTPKFTDRAKNLPSAINTDPSALTTTEFAPATDCFVTVLKSICCQVRPKSIDFLPPAPPVIIAAAN